MLLLSPASTAAGLERLIATDAHEGPVYVEGEHALYFTTSHPHVAIRRLDLASGELSTLRAHANNANGMTLGHDGRLIVCEQGSKAEPAAIVALDPRTGARETLVDNWHGLPLNSPNDVVVARDGGVWFTDPRYGYRQRFRPRPILGDRVYRLDPRSGELWSVADGLDKPNGLAFSPDESVLYVGDNGRPHRLLAFDVQGRLLVAERQLATLSRGHPDGLKVDSAGRIYTTTAGGIHIYTPGGRLLGRIAIPGAVNFTFGGPRQNVLYITADRAIWAASLNAQGA
jgi:gluconolactonase